MRTHTICLLVLLSPLAACDGRSLADPEQPDNLASAQCEIGEAAPDARRLDLALTVRSACAYCGPVTVRVAQAYPLDRQRSSRWLTRLVVDYGTESTRACDAVEADLDYPALVVWADLDGNGRCDPGVDRGALDQRYAFCCRDENVSVDLWSGGPSSSTSLALAVADDELCALLPPL